METERNKTIILRLYKDVFQKWNTSLINELVSDDFQDHLMNRSGDDAQRGPDVLHQLYTFLRSAFPDLRFTVQDIVSENHKVTVRWSFTGTHVGEFRGVPPTNQAIEVEGIAIYRLLGGKIVERWVSTNLDQLIKKLGDAEQG